MSPIRLIANLFFAAIVGTWACLALFFLWRYLRPVWGRARKPQHLILASASLGWLAFMVHVRGWMPRSDWVLGGLEGIALVSGVLVAVGVYLYEVEGGGRRR